MEIKELFDNAEGGTLTYDQFVEAANNAKAKFADLSDGKYVSVGKYNDDIASKTSQIDMLNTTISTRDEDLKKLQEQLKDAGTNSDKIGELTKSLTDLQAKYDGDTKAYQDKLQNQAYEFAVKEFANTKDFSSTAAKRDFERSLIDKKLKFDGTTIEGVDDFTASYEAENGDAFVTHEEPKADVNDTPHFSKSIQQDSSSKDDNAFHFNFMGVRQVEQ